MESQSLSHPADSFNKRNGGGQWGEHLAAVTLPASKGVEPGPWKSPDQLPGLHSALLQLPYSLG